jgi:hypothetical protein
MSLPFQHLFNNSEEIQKFQNYTVKFQDLPTHITVNQKCNKPKKAPTIGRGLYSSEFVISTYPAAVHAPKPV